jgi:hypothetical protein
MKVTDWGVPKADGVAPHGAAQGRGRLSPRWGELPGGLHRCPPGTPPRKRWGVCRTIRRTRTTWVPPVSTRETTRETTRGKSTARTARGVHYSHGGARAAKHRPLSATAFRPYRKPAEWPSSPQCYQLPPGKHRRPLTGHPRGIPGRFAGGEGGGGLPRCPPGRPPETCVTPCIATPHHAPGRCMSPHRTATSPCPLVSHG